MTFKDLSAVTCRLPWRWHSWFLDHCLLQLGTIYNKISPLSWTVSPAFCASLKDWHAEKKFGIRNGWRLCVELNVALKQLLFWFFWQWCGDVKMSTIARVDVGPVVGHLNRSLQCEPIPCLSRYRHGLREENLIVGLTSCRQLVYKQSRERQLAGRRVHALYLYWCWRPNRWIRWQCGFACVRLRRDLAHRVHLRKFLREDWTFGQDLTFCRFCVSSTWSFEVVWLGCLHRWRHLCDVFLIV